MKNPKKVLIICPFTAPNQGGVESHIQKLLKFLAKKKTKAIVVSYAPLTTPINAPFYEKKENYEIYRMPWFGNGWFPKIEHNSVLAFLYLVPGLLALSLFVGIKRQKEIDIIHSHGFAAGFVGLILGLAVHKRKVISTHAIYNFENRPALARIIKGILSHYDFILAVGEPSRHELVAIGLPSDKVGIHPNWIDTNFFKPTSKKHKGPLRLIFSGRGMEKKGIFIFGELARKNPRTQFLAIMAEGPDRQRFLDNYSKIKNLNTVTSLPSNFDEKMVAIRNNYQNSDIFIIPSIYPEGFATVVLEAASCGLAVLSSNMGTLPSMLEKSGAFLTTPTVENYDKILNKLTKDKRLLTKSKRSMREFALRVFSAKNAEVIYRSYFS